MNGFWVLIVSLLVAVLTLADRVLGVIVRWRDRLKRKRKKG